MTKTVLHALVASSVLLAGCTSVPTASNSLDLVAQKFQPEAGKASLYISREGDVGSSGTMLQMVLDGRMAGSLPTGTYQSINVDAGDHVLMLNIASGEQETMAPGRLGNESQIKFNAEPGKTYFFRASLLLGWGKARLTLMQVDSAEGQKDVTASKLAP